MVATKELVENFREIEKKSLESEQLLQNENADVCTVILKVDNEKIDCGKKVFELEMFGKTFLEWAENSVFETSIRYADYKYGEDFLPAVKRAVDTSKKYTFVLFADTPLFEHKTFLQIMEYFKMKGLSVLKLTRGYVFETKYLLEIDSLLNPQIQYFEEEDFITCYSLKQYSMICDIMKNRIQSYFMKNGVVFEDPASTFVDADVQIGKGTVIAPFNQIKGKTVIEDNVVIKCGNVITDSIICEHASISGSVVYKSLIGKDAVINEFCKISNNTQICDNVEVPSHCILSECVVKNTDKLKSFVNYKGEWYDTYCRSWKLWNGICWNKAQCWIYGTW